MHSAHVRYTLRILTHTYTLPQQPQTYPESERERELEDKNIYWNMYELLTAAVEYVIK